MVCKMGIIAILSQYDRGDALLVKHAAVEKKTEGVTMFSSSRTPRRYPVGTKYVLEGRGPFVRRYVEFPNGRRIKLATRKALPCMCAEREQTNIVPDHSADMVDASPFRRRIFA